MDQSKILSKQKVTSPTQFKAQKKRIYKQLTIKDFAPTKASILYGLKTIAITFSDVNTHVYSDKLTSFIIKTQ